jgi:hypothetical protein
MVVLITCGILLIRKVPIDKDCSDRYSYKLDGGKHTQSRKNVQRIS